MMKHEMDKKHTLVYKLQAAVLRPGRILPFFRQILRNQRLRASSADHLDFYGQVVDDDAVNVNPDFAVGSHSHDAWLEVGKIQFEYLLSHGLKPHHRFLDIGCGNLRLGWHLISYLDPGCYVGLDISPQILAAAKNKVAELNLQAKQPYLYYVRDTDYSFLPAAHFDRVQAHSVFSHLPLEDIERVLVGAKRVMKSGGSFDFTYHATGAGASQTLREHFCFATSELIDLAERCGYSASHMDDWNYPQDKIRAVAP